MRALKRWLTDPVESTMLQMPRALIASLMAAALDMSVLIMLVERFHVNPAIAAVLAYLPGTALQYLLCRYWVFQGDPRSHAGFGPFVLLALVGLLITWTVLRVLGDLAGTPYLAAKVVALGLAFTWNFLSRKWILFRSRREAPLIVARPASIILECDSSRA